MADFTRTMIRNTTNTPPTATDSTVTATEDTSFAFAASSFSFADEDAGARLESVTIETLPVPGTGTLRLGDSNMRAGASVTRAQIDSGTLTYLPSENGHGAAHASFSFRVSDGRDESASAYTMSIDVELTNDPATGAPLVTAPVVFRVPATLSVDLSAIEDIEGVTTITESATYRWNRFDAGGTIVAPDIATGPTYTLATADLGMRIGVEVTFNDDEGYEESITGEAFPTTGTIRSAGACPAPIHVGGATQIWSANVGLATVSTAGISVFGYFSGSAGSLGSLDNTALNTGTGTYTVERFTVSDSGLMTIRLDKALAPDEKRTLIAHVCDRKLLFNTALVDAARNYLWDSTGLDWSDYAQRAVYVSRDTVAPTFSRISVAGRSVVLTFSEALSAASGLANSAFTVMKTAQGVEETLTPSAAPAISGAAVTLTLSEEAVVSIDTVTVSYEKPDSGSNNKLADRTDNEVEDFTTEADAPPHVVSIVRQTPSASPTNADSLTWRVTFSKDVANVDATDFAVDGTTATPTVVAVMGSSRAYDVMASGGNLADLNDTLTLAFAEAQNIADTVGNALAGTVPTGTNESTWVVDNTAPTVASIVRQDPTASPTLADELTWRVTFSEEVANVDVADFTVTGTTATLTATAVAGSSLAYDVMASGGNLADLNGTVTLAFAEAQDIVDAVGHALATTEPTGTNDNTWMVDTTALAHCNASDAKEIWCASLTVGQYALGIDLFGFNKHFMVLALSRRTRSRGAPSRLNRSTSLIRSSADLTVRHTRDIPGRNPPTACSGQPTFRWRSARGQAARPSPSTTRVDRTVRLHLLQPGPVLVGQRLGPGQAARGQLPRHRHALDFRHRRCRGNADRRAGHYRRHQRHPERRRLLLPVDTGRWRRQRARHPGRDLEDLHARRRRRGEEGQGQDVVHRQLCDRRVAHERRVSLRDHRIRHALDFRHRPCRGNADRRGGHYHRRRRHPERRRLLLPVDTGRWRRQRARHPGRDLEDLHARRRRRGEEGQGQDVVHRQRWDRRVAHERRVS